MQIWRTISEYNCQKSPFMRKCKTIKSLPSQERVILWNSAARRVRTYKVDLRNAGKIRFGVCWWWLGKFSKFLFDHDVIQKQMREPKEHRCYTYRTAFNCWLANDLTMRQLQLHSWFNDKGELSHTWYHQWKTAKVHWSRLLWFETCEKSTTASAREWKKEEMIHKNTCCKEANGNRNVKSCRSGCHCDLRPVTARRRIISCKPQQTEFCVTVLNKRRLQ